MEHLKPVLVVGATGFLGMEICRQLAASHKAVKALVRLSSDPEKVKALENLGIETVTGDIKDILFSFLIIQYKMMQVRSIASFAI